MPELILTQGKSTLVDECDVGEISKYSWYALKTRNDFYAVRYEDKRVIGLHRHILACPNGLSVDHINGDPLDNRRNNLRIVTHQQNMSNRKKRKIATSKYKGVHWLQGKWRAEIQKNGKKVWRQGFNDELEAAKAYDKNAKVIFGEFALTNFKED